MFTERFINTAQSFHSLAGGHLSVFFFFATFTTKMGITYILLRAYYEHDFITRE